MISMQSVQLGYGKTIVLDNVNIKINHGDYVAIVGTNGCGKTTLLRSMMGMLSPKKGNITTEPSTKIGYVPQKDALDMLFPLTVFEVVQMGLYGLLKPWQRLQQKHKQDIHQVIEQVQLKDKAHHLFRDLSGGQRQKALIARALVARPNCIMLDEPATGIDIPGQYEILDFIYQIHHQYQTTVIMISHHLDLVMRYAQKVGIIYDKKLTCGAKEDIITSEKLSHIYQYPIHIIEVNGRKFITGAD